MLAVVLVAVPTAVAARMPLLPWHTYLLAILDGFFPALIALVSVWLICGHAPKWIRIAAVVPLTFLLSLVYIAAQFSILILRYWIEGPNSLTSNVEYYRGFLWSSTLMWTKPVAIGIAALCAWLYFARRAGWFDPLGDRRANASQTVEPIKFNRWANRIAIGFVCLVAIFPIALLYKLMTPTPLPLNEFSGNNGFDDFLEAGRMIGPATGTRLRNWGRLSDAQIRTELETLKPALDRMRAGIEKNAWNPNVYRPWSNEDYRAFAALADILSAQGELARRSKNTSLELRNNLDALWIAHAEIRGSASNDYFAGGCPAYFETDLYSNLWNMCHRLTAAQCEATGKELNEISSRREPWALRDQRRRIIEANAGWNAHLTSLLGYWSGEHLVQGRREEHFKRETMLQMVRVLVAMKQFHAKHSELPVALNELVPDYLPAVPGDPFGNGPMQYRKNGEFFALYSVGPDGDDDGATAVAQNSQSGEGDWTKEFLFP